MEDILARHDKAILQFSGGKDSLAVLELLKGFSDKITVAWCNTGSAFPHVVDFIYKTISRYDYNFVVVRPEQPQHLSMRQFGLPAHIVPSECTVVGRLATRSKGVKIQSWYDCCRRNIWEPMAAYVKQSGATLVIRGQRAAELHKGVDSGHVDGAVEYLNPIESWSEADVLSFLAERGVELPCHYGVVSDSLDCISCTAWEVFSGSADVKGRFDFMSKNYPLQLKEVIANIKLIHNTARAELDRLEVLFEGGQ